MLETTERFDELLERDHGDLSAGHVVSGTYRVLERLGTGGMADVYEAEHVRLGNRVALKVLRTGGRSDRPGIDRFRHEARRVAALTSEHVVKVFDCGELANGTPYLVMERLSGEDLRSLLEREGPLPIRRAVELAVGACRGLSAVHAAGLVHRDLKPANLFVVRRSDGTDWCKILDFGVAKALVSDATASGALLGTVRYMAPEQLEDASSARATADLYAMGAILYESLSGSPPHEGASLQELMFRIVHHDIVPLSKRCAVPVELEGIVMKALSRDKAKRYSSADELARVLTPFGAVAPRPQLVETDGALTLDERSVHPPARSSHFRMGSSVLGVALGIGATLLSVGLARGFTFKAASAPNVTTSSPPSTSSLPVRPVVPQAVAVAIGAPVATLAVVPRANATPAAARKPTQVSKSAAKPQMRADAPQAERFDTKNPYAE